jgi:bacteriorhodopsin
MELEEQSASLGSNLSWPVKISVFFTGIQILLSLVLSLTSASWASPPAIVFPGGCQNDSPSGVILANCFVGATALGALALHLVSWWPTRALADQDCKKGEGNVAAISVLINIIVYSFTMVACPQQIVCVRALGGTTTRYEFQQPLLYCYWITTSPQILLMVLSLLPTTARNEKIFRRAEFSLFVCLITGAIASFMENAPAYCILLAISWISGIVVYVDFAILLKAALGCVPAGAPKLLVKASAVLAYICWLLIPVLWCFTQSGGIWASHDFDMVANCVLDGVAKGGVVS